MTDGDRLSGLFEQAYILSLEARGKFIEEECGGDEGLALELSALLAAHDVAAVNPAWDQPAMEGGEIGERIGPYKIVSVIGMGGMGKVYRAVRADAQFDQHVAIKRIRLGMDAEQITRRFRAERQILANLEHPYITRLLDGGAAADGLPYLVMEYVEGLQPIRYCEERTLSLQERLQLFRQICSAVHYAHQHMVIHRDLKPSNILVTSDGMPKLLDFGIAKVFTAEVAIEGEANTETAMQLMTARYASPEQVRGATVTTATDIYSLGVILYELVSGHSPYRELERPQHELMKAVCEEVPDRPSHWRRELRGDLDTIILKSLRKDPAERYQSVDQFSEDIGRYLEGKPVAARGEALSYVAAKFIRRNWVAVGVGLVVFWLLIGGLIVTMRERARAERRFAEVRQLAHAVLFDYYDSIEHLAGSTPVLERLVKDALKYLDSLSSESDDPELQRELVDAYVKISHVQGDSNYANLGNGKGGMISAARAVEVAEKLMLRDRGLAAQASAAAAYSAQGLLLHGAGELTAAEGKLLRAVELHEAVAHGQPESIDAQVALWDTRRHLASLYGDAGMQNLGRTQEALAMFQQTDQMIQSFGAKTLAALRILKERRSTLMLLASVEVSLGRAEEGDRHLAQVLELGEAFIAKDPNDTLQRLEFANASLRYGLRLMDRLEAGQAVRAMRRASEILDGLLLADPKNAQYQRALSVTESQLAAALRADGLLGEAVPHNERSLALAEALSAGDLTSVEYLADVGISHRKLAESLLARGDAKGAMEHSGRAEGILCRAAMGSSDAYLQAHCGRAVLVTGMARLKAGQATAALESFERAVAIASQLASADAANRTTRSDLARALAGQGAALVSLRRRGEARGAYQQAMENWEVLRGRKALSEEEGARATETARILAGIQTKQK